MAALYVVQNEALSRELLTRSELVTVLHRQGFDGLEEVERCVLEPGGTFYIQRKLPATDQVQHAELIDQLTQRFRREAGPASLARWGVGRTGIIRTEEWPSGRRRRS